MKTTRRSFLTSAVILMAAPFVLSSISSIPRRETPKREVPKREAFRGATVVKVAWRGSVGGTEVVYINQVEDFEAVLKYGYREVDRTAFVCDSQVEAFRLAERLLDIERGKL